MLARIFRRLPLAAASLAALTAAQFAGCASTAVKEDGAAAGSSYATSISAREYGYVRPAGDVVVNKSRSRAKAFAGGSLWGAVAGGMRLDLHADPRIDRSLRRLRKDPKSLARLTRRAAPYIRTILAEINRNNFPTELAFVPHVESRYNPAATSPKAAGGMWQFMPYTAREMGLKLTSTHDERRDVLASTKAAMRYLGMLNKRFNGDWELAMAAYNCGPGRVESAQAANRRRGLGTDFWSLDLPEETRQYVPQILAAARLVAEAGGHKQSVPGVRTSSSTALAKVRLHQRTKTARADRSIKGGRQHIVKNGDTVNTVAMRYGLDPKRVAEINGITTREPLLPGQTLQLPTARQSASLIQYRVRRGDSFSSIARRYGVKVSDIRRWNDLADNRLNAGATLRIYRRDLSS